VPADYAALLHELVLLLSLTSPLKLVNVIISGSAIKAIITHISHAMDTAMEPVLVCSCHGASVIKASDLKSPHRAISRPYLYSAAVLITTLDMTLQQCMVLQDAAARNVIIYTGHVVLVMKGHINYLCHANCNSSSVIL
jgi:hypothetical protein